MRRRHEDYACGCASCALRLRRCADNWDAAKMRLAGTLTNVMTSCARPVVRMSVEMANGMMRGGTRPPRARHLPSGSARRPGPFPRE